MPTDGHLTALLRALQDDHGPIEGLSLLPTAASLLTELSNPLNVTLLTSQLLTAPAIWTRGNDLHICQRILGVFHSATRARLSVLDGRASRGSQVQLGWQHWIEAIAKGLDDRSPRWMHPLVLGGVLLGLQGSPNREMDQKIGLDLQQAFVRGINMALKDNKGENVRIPSFSSRCLAFVASCIFPHLSEAALSNLTHDALLPIVLSAMFFSSEGFQSGYVLGAIDSDVIQDGGDRFSWSTRSVTFNRLKQNVAGPLFGIMGSMSRLGAYLVHNVADSHLVEFTLDLLSAFTETLALQWRRNKLSELDTSEEDLYLSQETLKTTLPVLWQTLKAIMFSSIVVLQSAVARILIDPILANNRAASILAQRILVILQKLSFISTRLGSNAFSAYNFVYLTAIDVLSRYPNECIALLITIRPQRPGSIPAHPVERCLDLFFLNVAEHLSPSVPRDLTEELLIAAATPYLSPGANPKLVENLEAAHSLMLAVFSAPQNAHLSKDVVSLYVGALLQAFPQNLSPRQFRFAFRTLVRLSSPPFALSSVEGDLASVLMELVNERASRASTTFLTSPAASLTRQPTLPEQSVALSEQAALVLALVDALPSLRLHSLEEWLPLVAETLSGVEHPKMLDMCRQRFWDVLSNGEMDVDRSALCVTWWNNRGGREMVSPSGQSCLSRDNPWEGHSGAVL